MSLQGILMILFLSTVCVDSTVDLFSKLAGLFAVQ